MAKLDPWITGASLALTAALAYAACAALFLLFPALATSFLAALFHGLDFSKLAVSPGAFDFAAFSLVAVTLALYAFVVGVLFALIRNALSRRDPR